VLDRSIVIIRAIRSIKLAELIRISGVRVRKMALHYGFKMHSIIFVALFESVVSGKLGHFNWRANYRKKKSALGFRKIRARCS
jgi:hypothetical protein